MSSIERLFDLYQTIAQSPPDESGEGDDGADRAKCTAYHGGTCSYQCKFYAHTGTHVCACGTPFT